MTLFALGHAYQQQQQRFELEDLEHLAAAIEARKPDPAAILRLRAIHQFFDLESDENDRNH